MPESIHDYVVAELQRHKGRWPQISRATAISRRTIEKIARLEIENPGVKHIDRLAQYFRDEVCL